MTQYCHKQLSNLRQKGPNGETCIDKKIVRRQEKYFDLADEISERFNIPLKIIYANVPITSVKRLTSFKPDSDIRKRVVQQIGRDLNDKRGITGRYIDLLIGIDPEPSSFKEPAIVTAVTSIPKEAFSKAEIKDRIRHLRSALTAGQFGILTEVAKAEKLGNEYEAMSRVLVWAKEKIT